MGLQRSNAAKPQAEETVADVAEAAPVATEAAEVTADEAVLEDAPERPAPATAVAQRQETAVAAAAPRGNVVNVLADAGFSGLQIDWTSFPTIVLDGGEFGTSDGHPLNPPNAEFHVRLQQSRKRYVYRTNVENDDDAELAYSYDPSEISNPESEVAKKMAAWTDEGLTWSVKEYIEVVAIVEDEGLPTLNGQMVLLQIPPTSTGRFSGYLTANAMAKGLQPSQYLTRVFRGEKVVKAKKPFFPWAFGYAGK